MEPQGDERGRHLLPKPEAYDLLYCVDTRPQTVELAGDRSYRVELVDPWEMIVTPLGMTPPGTYTAQPPKADVAYRFTSQVGSR